MPYRPRSLSHVRTAMWAGVVAASTAGLLAAGTVDPVPAAAAPEPARSDSATLRSDPATAAFLARVQPRGKERVTAAVLDLDGGDGRPVVYGDDTPYDTASIVKVDILAAALLEAQDAGRDLTAQERAEAEAMIEHSDNAAAGALWRRIGLAPGLDTANKRLGLTSTEGGSGPTWGLTRTTASDQIRLLCAVFAPDHAPDRAPGSASPALNEESRTYLRALMSRVSPEQAWGVSAAGSGWALKNGWLQRTTTGLWDVNSVGRITTGGRRYLVVVLSDGSTTMRDGVSMTERAARAAVSSAAAR
ncbi:serine hydrolase [Streptomyces sp. NPDC001544]|uniref:serine hydrolase n=1 Tax=Streptomyces sp. NPDC001544 TaxID=3364584 RepID=UPI0036CC059A